MPTSTFRFASSELTKVRVGRQPTGDPNHLVVPLADDWLYNCPYIHMEDVGTLLFSEAEVLRVRDYLLKGGFIWVDDSWGPWAQQQWEEQIGRVLPPDAYPIRDITPDHVVFRTMFEVPRLPQIPAISHWRRLRGRARRSAARRAPCRSSAASATQHGNLMVLMTHNTDISDAWEREGEDPQYFYQFSPDGYAVGLNVVLYAMMH